MKILVATTFTPPDIGGAERIVWNTLRELSKSRELEIHVLTCTQNSDPIPNVRIHVLPKAPLYTLYYSTLGKKILRERLSGLRFDVIHSHMALPWGYLLRDIPGKRIISLHGEIMYSTDPAYRYLAKKAFLKTDAVISPSRKMIEFVRQNYNVTPLLIRNGISLDMFHNGTTKLQKNTVLFIGRYIRMKGILELLAAARELKDIEFWFAGKGPLGNRINLPNTKDLGYLKNEDLARVYNEASVCAFPSHDEAYPTVAMEAMACAKAIVATSDGFSEIIEDGKTGILVPAKDPERLADVIRLVMEDSTLRESLEEESYRKSREFDIGIIARQYLQLYADLCRNKGGRQDG